MRITFVCGSFEPGRDGVGDYVAQFARALRSLGNTCQVIALADRHATATGVTRIEGFEVVRVPAARWRAGDIETAVAAVRRFAPDWVSLQMVSYGYERHGLLLASPRRFDAFRIGVRRHLMLHELWVGEVAGCGVRERLLGAAQKWSLRRAVRRWAAHVTHTSNPTYGALLAQVGVAAEQLPLPGNLPLVPIEPLPARELVGVRAGLDTGRTVLAVVFGAVHPEWVQGSWLEAVAAACERRGDTLALVHLGRAGATGRHLWQALSSRHAGVRFAELGELPAAEASIVLQGFDLGIATTPWQLVGKSGTVAAMLEHGLPVLVPRADYRLRRGMAPDPVENPGLHRFGEEFLELVRCGGPARRPPRVTHDVYRQFLASLESRVAVAGAVGTGAPA